MPDADPVDELIQSLDEASGLLRNVGADFWAEQLERGRLRISAGDAYGLRAIAGLFGGMGSFNDLIVHPINGHNVEVGDVDEVNERLDQLRGSISRRTRELIRELDLP